MFASTAIQYPWPDNAELSGPGGPNRQPIEFAVSQLPNCAGETWMVVDANAREFFRDTSAGGVTVPGSTDFGQASKRSSVWLKISWTCGGATNHVVLDLAAGGRYAVFGSKCETFIVGPPGSKEFVPGSSELAIVDPLVGFCLTSVALSRSPTPLGDRHGRLSQRVKVPANLGRETTIPPCAAELEIFEVPSPTGTTTDDAWQWLGGGGSQHGPVNLDKGQSDRVLVPGFVWGLEQPTARSSDRYYSFVYRIAW